jgi:hypothetical protein
LRQNEAVENLSSKGKYWLERVGITVHQLKRWTKDRKRTESLNTLQELPFVVGTLSDIEQEAPRSGIEVSILLDTGAAKNFVSQKCLDRIALSKKLITPETKLIRTGIHGHEQRSSGMIQLELSMMGRSGNKITHVTQFIIIDSPMEVIIGRDSLREWNLVMEFPSHFLSEDEAQTILRIGRDNPSEVGQNSGQGDGGTTERMIQSDMREKTPFTRTAFQQEDIDEIAENYLQALPAEMIPTNFSRMSESEFDLPKDFHGPSELQKGRKELVWEFRDRFRSSVSEEPARVEVLLK